MNERLTNAHDLWVDRDAAVVWHGFTQMSTYGQNRPVIVAAAEGRELIDVDGRRYLDAISSLWVTTIGHRVPELDQAVNEQLQKVAHSTMLGNGNIATIELAEALAPQVPVSEPHFLFASDGAAAVEQAIKIAFQYWTNRKIEGRTRYLSFGGAYHGDTIGSISVGDSGFGVDVFDPLRFNVLRAPGYDDKDWAETAVAMIRAHHHELAAVVIEPLVQGAAGMWMTDPDSVKRVGDACREHDVILIADEVATGFGRTGTLFASQQCRISPDIMVIGKGLTGGYLPMAATVASKKIYDAFLGPDLSEFTFYHGHSFSGNAICAAVAKRHLELFTELDVIENVRLRSSELADLLKKEISPRPYVKEIRLQGLMGGIELAPPTDDLRWGRKVCAAAVEQGVLLRPLGDVIVLMPILTSTSDEIERIVTVLASALDEVCQ